MYKVNRDRLSRHKFFYFLQHKLKKVNIIKRGVLVIIALRVINPVILSQYQVLFNLLELTTTSHYDGYLHREDFKTKYTETLECIPSHKHDALAFMFDQFGRK